MVARRLVVLASIVLLSFLLVASLAPRETSRRGDEPRTATGARPPAAAPGDARRVSATVNGAAERPAVVRARVGDLLALRVTAPAPDEVELVGLRRFDAADSFSPARFEFFVARAGTFPIRLREARRVVGRLVFSGA